MLVVDNCVTTVMWYFVAIKRPRAIELLGLALCGCTGLRHVVGSKSGAAAAAAAGWVMGLPVLLRDLSFPGDYGSSPEEAGPDAVAAGFQCCWVAAGGQL